MIYECINIIYPCINLNYIRPNQINSLFPGWEISVHKWDNYYFCTVEIIIIIIIMCIFVYIDIIVIISSAT